MFFEPREQLRETGCGKGYAGVCSTVVEPHRISISYPAAWKYDLVNISENFVTLFRRKDPLIRPRKDSARIFQIQKSQPQPVNRAAGRRPDTMVENQPTLISLERRR